jgi:hypothetical protein
MPNEFFRMWRIADSSKAFPSAPMKPAGLGVYYIGSSLRVNNNAFFSPARRRHVSTFEGCQGIAAAKYGRRGPEASGGPGLGGAQQKHPFQEEADNAYTYKW